MNEFFSRIELVFLAVICLGIALLFPVELAANNDESRSTNAAELLRIGTGAKAPSMGNAFTGAADGVSALHYNPAGLAFAESNDFGVMVQDRMINMSLGTMEFVSPNPSFGSAWGVGIKYQDFGRTDRTTIHNDGGGGVIGQNQGTFTGMDMAAGVSYGIRLGQFGLGISGKAFRSKIDNAQALGAFVDLGIQWRSPDSSTAVGFVMQNLGNRLKYDKEQEHAPLLFRGGISQGMWQNMLRFHLDIEHVRRGWKRGKTFLMTGMEVSIQDMVSFRTGWDGRIDAGRGLTAGVGLNLDFLEFDYAFVPMGEIGNNHRFSLTLRFGEGWGEGQQKNEY